MTHGRIGRCDVEQRFTLGGLTPIVAGVLLGLAILAPAAMAGRLSEDAKRCGGETNTIEADIQLAAARDVWKVLPALGISPELETDNRPAHLIIFKGEYKISGILSGRPGAPSRLSQVVCVIQEDGTKNLYVNVVRDGSTFSD